MKIFGTIWSSFFSGSQYSYQLKAQGKMQLGLSYLLEETLFSFQNKVQKMQTLGFQSQEKYSALNLI